MQTLKCMNCAGPVFYTRRYSGESLCSACFRQSIESKVRRTISKYRMLRHGERVAVAVSGGKDSLSLLTIMAKIVPKHGSELVAITVDEGIEGYRDESISNARLVTERLGVPLHVVSYKQLFGFTQDQAISNRTGKVTSCAMCGTFRRRAIDVASEQLGIEVLATAHNLDDMVQTFMINLMNCDLKRLGWFGGTSQSERFKVRRIHPFMEIYEKEAALYAFASGLPMQSTHCPYMDEGIRSSIRIYLNSLEEAHPGIKNMMLKSALGVAERLRQPKTESTRCISCGRPSTGELCSTCELLSTLSTSSIPVETPIS